MTNTRIVQLTDLHLFAHDGGRLAGVPTREAFDQALAHVERHQRVDHLVLTGDLAQDEEPSTYEHLRNRLGPWLDRLAIVPGNHDDRDAIRSTFPGSVPASGYLTFSFRAGKWRVLGLDSHVPGQVEGRIDADQLDWLRAEVERDTGAPVLLFLHHPPVSLGVAWLDKLLLEDPAPLIECVRSLPQIRCIACGHVHQDCERRIGETKVLTTPSTAMQFSSTPGRLYEQCPAGYRVFELEGRHLRTEVIRLPTFAHPPIEPAA